MGSESGDWGTDAFERSPVRPNLRSGVADSLRGATAEGAGFAHRRQTRLQAAGPCPLNRTSQARRLLRLSRKSLGSSDVLEDMWTIGARVVWNAGRSRSELVVPPSVQHRGAANEVPPTKSPIGAGFPRATRRGAWGCCRPRHHGSRRASVPLYERARRASGPSNPRTRNRV
jgi:hypothetical protein